MEDKEISDLFADGKMTVKNMWIMAYDSKTGKKGWISMDSILSDIVQSFEKTDASSTVSEPKGCGKLYRRGSCIAKCFALFLCPECQQDSKSAPKTMHEEYGDGSDHEICKHCGFCKTCKDCENHGCIDNSVCECGHHTNHHSHPYPIKTDNDDLECDVDFCDCKKFQVDSKNIPIDVTQMAFYKKGKRIALVEDMFEEIKKHVITEHDLQNAKAIEFSFTGELVPLEVVEVELNKLKNVEDAVSEPEDQQ